MTEQRLRIADGKVAIWIDRSDDLPFTTPLAHISRVKFHSDLDYLPIVSIYDASVTLPAIPASGSGQGASGSGRRGLRTALYNLAAHGMGFTPFVVGEITLSGVPLAMAGSMPVAQVSGDNYARWVALGADSTNITLYEYSVQRGFHDIDDGWVPRPATTLSIRMYVSAVNLDADNPPEQSQTYLYLDSDEIRLGSGFSSNNRYIREVSNTDDAVLWAVDGRTLSIAPADFTAGWRWSMGSVTRVGGGVGSPPAGGFNSIRPVAL